MEQINYFSQEQIFKEMRNLWIKHSWQDREATISIINNLSSQQSSVNWALKTPRLIANVYRRYYTQQVSSKIENALVQHIKIAGDVITDSKMRNMHKLQVDTNQWYKNANDFAYLMGSINHYTPENKVSNMMKNHLALLSRMTTQMIQGAFDQSIDTFEQVLIEAEQMGDFFARGLINQFNI